ncbi:Transcription factor IIIB subunit [Amphibalanus amphitrite]|uniref:Transcription factor IIIB subunit n=1 Tax=Amphibalanus amphitrite TaxID=1232801 RepID=A0A6A4W256_AMPAM|nr:Transcription factor IIIB subunit [Amphibalanus amphitrite]
MSDPCVYVLRYANKLELGSKTHEVSVTAARLMQRMKRDWIHMGRRPSGLCGAALLMAARLHGFNRTVDDIIKIVRVHQSTVKKRLSEFKNTPSSSLTVEEFMTVDLEDEMDPPAFTKSRKKDKERISQARAVIDCGDWAEDSPPQSPGRESQDASLFVQEQTLASIRDIAGDEIGPVGDAALMPPPPPPVMNEEPTPRGAEHGLGVSRHLLGLTTTPGEDPSAAAAASSDQENASNELDLEGIDDAEIDSYIMSPREIHFKTKLWMKLNADFLKEQAEKQKREEEERLQREKEGKPEKKKRPPRRKRNTNLAANTAEEAIEKMLQEKRISNKINYDVLREITGGGVKQEAKPEVKVEVKPDISELVMPSSRKRHLSSSEPVGAGPSRFKRQRPAPVLPGRPGRAAREPDPEPEPEPKPVDESGPVVVESGPVVVESGPVVVESGPVQHEDDEDEGDYEEEDTGMLSAAQLLSQHGGDDYGGYDEEEYY